MFKIKRNHFCNLMASTGAIIFFNSFTLTAQDMDLTTKNNTAIPKKVDSLLTLMTVEEKVGQMNQYNGFWEFTGPAPEGGSAEKKFEHLKKTCMHEL